MAQRHLPRDWRTEVLISFETRIVPRDTTGVFSLFDVARFALLEDERAQKGLELPAFFKRTCSLFDFPFRQRSGSVVVTTGSWRGDQKPACSGPGTRTRHAGSRYDRD